MSLFNNYSEIFNVFFLAGLGWAVAGLLRDITVSVINHIAAAIVNHKQREYARRGRQAYTDSSFAQQIKGE